jgi:TonB family protein
LAFDFSLRSVFGLLLIVVSCIPHQANAQEGQSPEVDTKPVAEQQQDRPLSPPVLLGTVTTPVPDGTLPAGSPAVQTVLSLVIDEDGQVIDQAVAITSGVPAIDEIALATAPYLSFLPAARDGVPVLVTIDFPFRFLPEPPEEPEIPPAVLSGRVEALGSKEPLALVGISLYQATEKPQEEQVKVKGGEGRRDVSVNYELSDEAIASTDTDADGRFVFNELPPGSFVALVGSGGYKKVSWLEEFDPGQEREVVYRLVPVQGAETVVIARREPGVPERVLTRDELFKVPGAANDPVEALKSLPGVSYAPRQDSSSDVGVVDQTPVVRGASSEDSVAYLDGLPSPILIHSVGTESVLPDYAVESALLAPAAASARYGDLIGAVLGLELRSPRSDRIGGFLQPGFSMASGAIEGPITKKSRFYIGFRRSYYEAIFALFFPKDAVVDFATVPLLQDQQVVLETDLLDWMTLRFAYLGTLDAINILSREDDDGRQERVFSRNTILNRFQLELEMRGPKGAVHVTKPAVSFWNTRFEIGETIDDKDTHTTFHLLDTYEAPLLSWLNVSAGAMLEVDYSNRVSRVPQFAREDTGPSSSIEEEQFSQGQEKTTRLWHSGWLSAEFKPVKELRITPEIRLDAFGAIQEFAAQPRLRLAGDPASWLTLSLAGGRYQQLPSLQELNAISGNPDLETERAWHINAAIDIQPGPWLDVNIQGYAKFLDNLVVQDLPQATFSDLVQGVGNEDSVEDPTHGLSNLGKGRIYGAEVFLRYAFFAGIGFNGWVGYSLSWSERKDFEDEEWRWFASDRRHQLTVLMQLTFPGEVSLGARWMVQSGRPRTPVDSAVFFADSGTFLPVYGDLYAERSMPYHQLDLRLDKKVRKPTHIINFFIEATNVYYAKTDDLSIPSYDYRESAGFSLIPQVDFGFRLEF